ncbi:MAG: ATP-binding cassette domain-containing protein [Bacteroidota bacterium]|nr:MAG: ATP-binding cassette domain-containing protein [Bacteroidota bacterium]
MNSETPRKKISLSGLKELFKLYRFIRPYRREYALGMLLLLISSAASLAFPKLLGDLVDIGQAGMIKEQINRIGLLLVVVLLLQATASYFRILLFVRVTEKTLADLRRKVYNHLIRLPLKFFQGRRVGELNSRLSADISLLQDAMTTTLAEFIRQILIIVGGISLLMFTSMKLTLFMLAVLPVVMVLVIFFGRYIRKLSKEAQNQVAESNVVVEETLQGIQSVKSFTNEYHEMDRYREITGKIAQTGIQNGRMQGAFSSFIILGLFGAMVAVIWKGADLLGKGELQTGELFSFIIYSGFIGGTIGGLASVLGRVQKFVGATENLLEILDEKEETVQENLALVPEQTIKGRIRFDNLRFEYPSRLGTDVLTEISFSVEPNNLIALVGPSGAGKSTLVSLLMRLYEPSSGRILFDGKESTQYSLTALRSQMAVVPQDIFLFGGTIAENIAYGRWGASHDEIVEAAKQANAWQFISEMKDGLETLVGERGTQLSGGQRQRIAIARALLKNPQILILDEATSSLDSESERLVQEALEKLMQGRTSIVIAHRLATIRRADNIIVLDKGRIVEQGTHEHLMKLDKGVYRGLSELQFAV